MKNKYLIVGIVVLIVLLIVSVAIPQKEKKKEKEKMLGISYDIEGFVAHTEDSDIGILIVYDYWEEIDSLFTDMLVMLFYWFDI